MLYDGNGRGVMNATRDRDGVEGSTLAIGRNQYHLVELMASHPDRSETYRTSGEQKIVRVYFDSTQARATDRLLTKVSRSDEILAFTYAGTGRLLPPNRTKRHRGRAVWATIRNFASSTLKDLLAGRSKEVGPTDTYRVALDLARGIGALHQAGIAHGDIRPSNILVGTGKNPFRIVDYGLAIDGVEIAQSEALFLAPESLRGGSRNDFRADWYSYGKVIRTLYERSTPADEMKRELIWKLTEECLQLEPGRRPELASILKLLEASTDEPPLINLADLRRAVYADVTTRVGVAATVEHLGLIQDVISSTTQRVQEDLSLSKSFRPATMSEYELIHLLGTLSLADKHMLHLGADQTVVPRPLRSIISLATSSFQQHSLMRQGERSIDAEWAAEISDQVRGDFRGRNYSREQVQREIERQIDLATDISNNVLKSNGFLRSEEVATMMSSACPGITAEEVRVMRDLGYLVSLPVGDINLYPVFQFDPAIGMPRDCIKVVSDMKGYLGSSWGRSLDWMLRVSSLGGVSPAEWLESGGAEDAVVNRYSTRAAA